MGCALALYIVVGVRKGIESGKALGSIGYVDGGELRDGISERRSVYKEVAALSPRTAYLALSVMEFLQKCSSNC